LTGYALHWRRRIFVGNFKVYAPTDRAVVSMELKAGLCLRGKRVKANARMTGLSASKNDTMH
jgi:hypothetical protein